MHIKYKLRQAKSLVTPKGPNFARAKTLTCDIDRTVLKLKLPKHRPSRFSSDKPLMPEREYQWDEVSFRSRYSEGFHVSDHWDYFELIQNAWAFYGPWFTGVLAEIRMYVNLIKPVKYENDDFSLFHPRAFENIIGDYLTNEFSTRVNEFIDYRHEYIAPLNWQPLTGLPMVAVRLQVKPDPEVTTGAIQHFAFFPITDKVMVCMQFNTSRHVNLSEEELDKRVSNATMLELIDNIINSVELTLSPEALAQQKAALAGLGDASLIKEFLPLKWKRPEPKKPENLLDEDTLFSRGA